MREEIQISPAEAASIECIQKVYQAIDENKSFRVEAGAGAGKTYTLIKALKYLIGRYSDDFQKSQKRIACITYTNVAKDEIRSRVDNHPIIYADTIHAFAWDAIQGYQQALRDKLPELGEKWIARIDEAGGVKKQKVKYDLGYPKMTDTEAYLHHNDVIKLFSSFLSDQKFKKIFSANFPIILVDEYQDTNKGLADALVENFIVPQSGSTIGFFGDHWQKIYGSESCGLIEADTEKLVVIGKQANFRSDKNIVDVLNKMRPELEQHEHDPDSLGEVIVYHTNGWVGERRTGAHWNGDLPAEAAHQFLEGTKARLNESGWDISPSNTKVLMLTHNVLAAEQGYQTIASSFSDNDDFLSLKDPYMDFLIATVENGLTAFRQRKYGAMMDTFGIRTSRIRNHADKKVWQESMIRLQESREHGTVGSVIDLLKETRKPRLTEKIEAREEQLSVIMQKAESEREEEEKKFYQKNERIRSIPYSEVPSLASYIDNRTLYSTKHGVKGAEFENVIVVLGRGWNQYNWSQFLEFVNSGDIPDANRDSYERNRNLFYVACSRPKHRLCLLFTQELSGDALSGLQTLFGETIHDATT
jgi:DNA helicase-2/ATP-dependent DNA helicase PcrA